MKINKLFNQTVAVKSLLTIFAAIVFVMTGWQSHAASPTWIETAAEIHSAQEILTPYLNRAEDGTFTLDVQDPASLGVSTNAYQKLKSSLEQTNSMVRSGLLETTADMKVYETESTHNTNGNDIEYYPFGFVACFDNRTTNLIVRQLEIGGMAFEGILTGFFNGPGNFNSLQMATVIHLAYSFLVIGPGWFDWANNVYGCGACFLVVWEVGPIFGWPRSDC